MSIVKKNLVAGIDSLKNMKPKINPHHFLSATKLKKFILMSEVSSASTTQGSQKNSQRNTFKNGLEFEAFVIDSLKRKLISDEYVSVLNSPSDCLKVSKHLETFYYMKIGVPIIFHAVVHNDIDSTFGVPDILVRSDYLNRIVKYPGVCLPTQAPFIEQPHYRVVDIKLSNISLMKDLFGVQNSKIIRYYKTQLYLYNKALSIMQGFNPDKAYILPKSCQYAGVTYNWTERFGHVDYNNYDRDIDELYTKSISLARFFGKRSD